MAATIEVCRDCHRAIYHLVSYEEQLAGITKPATNCLLIRNSQKFLAWLKNRRGLLIWYGSRNASELTNADMFA